MSIPVGGFGPDQYPVVYQGTVAGSASVQRIPLGTTVLGRVRYYGDIKIAIQSGPASGAMCSIQANGQPIISCFTNDSHEYAGDFEIPPMSQGGQINELVLPANVGATYVYYVGALEQ